MIKAGESSSELVGTKSKSSAGSVVRRLGRSALRVSDFTASHLDATREGRALLLEGHPVLADLHSSTTTFAQAHDASLLQALARLLALPDVPPLAAPRAQHPLSAGSLGLLSAEAQFVPAYWVSWADTLAVLHRHLPATAEDLTGHLEAPSQPAPSLQAAAASAAVLGDNGWDPPAWHSLLRGAAPRRPRTWRGSRRPRLCGWQRPAALTITGQV